MANRVESGFTIIEIIVVMVLVGIIAAVIVPRFTSPNAFGELAAQDAILAEIRATQQAALGRDNVSFKLTSSGGEWSMIIEEDGSTIRSNIIADSDLTLETGSTLASGDDCASAFDTPVMSDFEITFDGLGNAIDFTNNSSTESISNGVRICLNDTVQRSICVSPGGYANQGDCDA